MDFLPDVAVGRAPVTTVAQAQTFVAKSIAALAAQDGARPVSVVMAANALFPETPTPLDLAGSMELLLPILAAHPGTHVARLYQLSANWPGSFPENRQSVLDSLDQGYDVALLNGAGGPGQFQAGNYPADLINAAEFGALTNATPTFAFFMSAYTTQPGPGSIGAAWVNDAAGGATSVIGPTYVEFISLGNEFMREFVHQTFELHVPTQGEALAATIAVLPFQLTDTSRLTSQGNLLFGDPALAWPGSLEGGTTPTLLSLVDSETAAGVARLSWYASDAAGVSALVERREDGTDWLAVGAPVERGDGLFTYEDRVESGGRFAYRLRLADGAVSEEVWLTIPGAEGLHLAGFAPNPAVGPLRVAFTLPSAEPATIEIVNVAGRRIAQRDVGALGPGAHVVEFSEDASAPGVYWIRLAQGARVLVARGVRLR
jgi:hypothetical protein